MKRYTSNITARPRGSVSSAGSVSQSVSQLFHGPAPRSPLHRLAVRLRHSRSTGSGLVARADVPLGMCVCAFVGRVGCEGMCEGYLCEVCPSDPCPCVRVSRVSRLPPVSSFTTPRLVPSGSRLGLRRQRLRGAGGSRGSTTIFQAFAFPHRAGGLPRRAWEAPLDEGCNCA